MTNKNMSTQTSPRDPRHFMRWVMMLAFLLALFGSLADADEDLKSADKLSQEM
jgi:hypothetical protein